jgi:DNA-binding MarR family transcriptional regulator
MQKPLYDLEKDNSVDPAGEFAMNVPDHFFYLLYQVGHRRDMRLEERLHPVGLTLPRWRTLAVVRRMGACSMKELSQFCAIDRTTLTRSIDQLVAAGLIDRSIPPNDRRKVILTLTRAGEETYGLAVAQLLDSNREAAHGISDDEQRRLARALETILKNLILDAEETSAILSFGRTGLPRTSAD